MLLDLSGLGVSAYEADDWLVRRHGVSLGLSDLRHVLAVFSVGVTQDHARRLVRAIRSLAKEVRRRPHRFRPPKSPLVRYCDLTVQMAIGPAEAFAADTELVAYEKAVGRVAAEIIAPAPPGVPRLLPGQLITSVHIAFLTSQRDGGMFVLDPADPSEHKLRVVKAAT